MTRLIQPAGNNPSAESETILKKLTGFPAVALPSARVLILGSMPGKRSLDEAQYYAHPRNAFWKIMEACFGVPSGADYDERCRRLAACDIALWDVIGCCEREGSLDSAIRPASLEPNEFGEFFNRHPAIGHVFFNGAKAEDVFKRLVLPAMGTRFTALEFHRLPSTSPAYAALSFEEKLKTWRKVCEVLKMNPS